MCAAVGYFGVRRLLGMRPIYFIAAITGFLLIVGCASKTVKVTQSGDLPLLLGRRVTMIGTPIHGSPGTILFENHYISIEGMESWPTNLIHQQVQVSGLLHARRGPGLFEIENAHLIVLS